MPKEEEPIAGINKIPNKYYTWQDTKWSSFMVSFLKNLEPRRFKKGEIIYRDLEEVEEIYFINSGDVSILIVKSLLVCNRLHFKQYRILSVASES